MKKFIAIIAAFGLVGCFASSALALDTPGQQAEVAPTTSPRIPEPTAPGVSLWSVTGSWSLAGAYLSNGYGWPGGAAPVDLGPGETYPETYPSGSDADLNGDGDAPDAFYIYSFKIQPTLQINDKISMEAELRFADRDVYGLTDTKQFNPVPTATTQTGGRVIDTYLLWMNWVSPWGKTQFGRMPAGAWGTTFLNSSTQGDRLRWYPNMLPENWGMLLFMQKVSEQDAGGNAAIADQDADGYYVDLSYKAPFGKTTGAFWAVRNATNGVDPWMSTNFWLTGNYNFDAFNFEYELNYGFGDAGPNINQDNQLGLYGNLSYMMDDWKFGGLAFYASGDDNGNSDGDNSAIMSSSRGLGKDFNPFQILTGDYMNLLNGDNPLSGDFVNPLIANSDWNSGAWGVQGYANFAMSPALSFSGYIGYAAATDSPATFDDNYGVEAGVGFTFKLMDNLAYGAHFSYLWTGDYFKGGDYDLDTQNVYLIAHALSMSF